jgi:hypothetical protein
MSIALLLPAVYGIVLLVVVALTTVYRARPHDIDHVILLARKLDPADLEMLLDAGAEWNLRRSLTPWAFRAAQEDRIRLVREYLQRVGHNAALIQLWVMPENQLLEGKAREKYTERDLLVVEAARLALELRLYSIAVSLRIWFWMLFRMYRWPRLLPRVTDLRVQCGVNVIEKYRRLTELAVALSARYGKKYQDRLHETLQSGSV